MSAFNNYALFTRMPSGVPGAISRFGVGETVEPALQSSSGYLTGYGLPVAYNTSGDYGVRGITTADVSSNIVGFIARPFPLSDNSTSPALGTSTPPGANNVVDILKRGYMTVLLGGSAAAVKGGKVYARIGNASTGKVVGDIEAANDLSVTAAATVGTGTQTAGSLSATDATPVGVYTVTMTSGAKFAVTDAAGQTLLTSGSFATHYTLDNGLAFTMTTGGTPTTGDTTAITVADNTILIPHCFFTGAADGSGNVEISYNIN